MKPRTTFLIGGGLVLATAGHLMVPGSIQRGEGNRDYAFASPTAPAR